MPVIDHFSRRSFLAVCVAAALRPSCGWSADDAPAMGLGFSLYGMKTLPLDEALQACAKIGYDCVELPVMEGWPADALAWPTEEQDRFRRGLEETGLRLTALMENLPLAVDDARHAANLRRLEAAGKVAERLSPDVPRIVETVLGGRPAEWETSRERMAARLCDWAKVAEQGGFVLAIKAHVGGALHTPSDAVWLMEQAASPHVRCAYDYSHFQLRGLGLAESIATLAPHSVFVHVKDAEGEAGRFRFLLPGEGATNYVEYLQRLAAAGYRGDVVVEVSGQIHGRPDYRPLAAAQFCYDKLAPAFKQAAIRRR